MNHDQQIKQIQTIINQSRKILPRGAGSKPVLSHPPSEVTSLSMENLAGIITYNPAEYTFTAFAGTPLRQIQGELAKNSQYLPFDPLLADRGATLGGAVASGLNGPGRFRYGGMRDFILAVRFVDGLGNLVKSGAKVVKNAAGFDLPKLMVGSLGRMGVMIDITFKVFPKMESFVTFTHQYNQVEDALETLWKFSSVQLDLEAVELTIYSGTIQLQARIGGSGSTIQKRSELLRGFMGNGEMITGTEEELIWTQYRELKWVPGNYYLVKVPMTPSRISQFEASVNSHPSFQDSLRQYSSGGQVAWIAFPGGFPEVMEISNTHLSQFSFSGLIIQAPEGVTLSNPILGTQTGKLFTQRIKSALDPDNRFLEV
jgi:glycolate oxidase FAD binding subunit